MNNEKIGLGIITCNRKNSFFKCLNSIDLSKIDELVIINDGQSFEERIPHKLIQHEKNLGVGISKNEAFQYLIEQNCKHIFLIEDDIFIKNNNVFNEYIKTSKHTGVKHLMWGFHGPANRSTLDYSVYNPRKIVKYKTCNLVLNLHCVGAFCYYDREVLDEVGFNDPFFKNAWEHVEHSYRIFKAGYIPGYWWWPDIDNSSEYLEEQNNSLTNSSITGRPEHLKNINSGAEYFYKKHNFLPTTIPQLTLDHVLANLKTIYKKYGN